MRLSADACNEDMIAYKRFPQHWSMAEDREAGFQCTFSVISGSFPRYSKINYSPTNCSDLSSFVMVLTIQQSLAQRCRTRLEDKHKSARMQIPLISLGST